MRTVFIFKTSLLLTLCTSSLAFAQTTDVAGDGGTQEPARPAASAPDTGAANVPPDAGLVGDALDTVSPQTARSLTTVVTGTRAAQRLEDTAVATEVITRADIVASGSRDAVELLSAHPGLEVTQGVFGANVNIQGLSSEYVLVLVDGERVPGKLNGAIDLSRLSLESVEQVEIVKGPASALYGADAVGGVINIITRRAQKPLGADLQLSYGATPQPLIDGVPVRPLGQLDVDATGQARGDLWGLRVSGGVERRDAYDLTPADVATTGSSLEGYQVSARGELGPRTAPLVELSTSYAQRVQAGVDLTAAGAVIDRMARDDTFDVLLSPHLVRWDGGQLRLDARYALYQRRYLEDQRNASALDRIQDTREQQARLGLQLDTKPFNDQDLSAGLEGFGEALASERLEGGTGQRGRLAAFVQDTWTPVIPIPLSPVAGGRFDLDSQFGSALTPRVAVRISPLPAYTLRASYGHGFRAPSFQELLIDFENPGAGYVVHGSTQLKPERSRSVNVSNEWTPVEGSLLWLNLFHHQLEDKITATLVGQDEGLRYSYVNIARARVRGLELGLRQQLWRGASLDLGYTLTDGWNEELQRALEGQAPHRVTAQARWRFRPWGLETWVRGAWTSSRPFYVDPDGDGVTETGLSSSYVTVDARITKDLFAAIRLFAAGTNLAGAGNPVDLTLPPRAFQLGLSAQL